MGSSIAMEYILGHSEREIQRLILQASILRPTTRRLLRRAGIGEGMRVLDLGCGAGDVSMIAAELVGASGTVVGIDRNPEVLEIARARAYAAGLRQVEFREAAAEDFTDPMPFDAAVGRYVLIHQVEPSTLIRRSAGLVRPGGSVAFHELCLDEWALRSLPPVPLWHQAGEWLRAAFRSTVPHCDAGGRLVEHFAEAGLPRPDVFCEVPVGGGDDSPLYAWVAGTLESVLPHLARTQVPAADLHPISTFDDRLRAAVVGSRSQLVGPPQFCAWARVGSP
jgi:SAM-dependent methyltransferase